MARAGLLDVPCNEPRQAEAGGALRLDLEPQFRGPPRLQGPYASGLAGHGRGSRDRRTLCRCEGMALEHDVIRWDRHHALALCLSMISAQTRSAFVAREN